MLASLSPIQSPVRCPLCRWTGILAQCVAGREMVAECPDCRTKVMRDDAIPDAVVEKTDARISNNNRRLF
jgi:hypothetical protein